MKRHTIEQTRARIKAMCGKTLAECHLKDMRKWGKHTYWLVFTEDDMKEILTFDRIQDVWNWLDKFDQRKQETI